MIGDYEQSSQVFFRETILLIAPLVQVHTAVIGAADATKESHAIFGSSMTGAHDLMTTSRRWCTIDGSNTPGGVFTTMICNIEPNHWSTTT